MNATIEEQLGVLQQDIDLGGCREEAENSRKAEADLMEKIQVKKTRVSMAWKRNQIFNKHHRSDGIF